MSHKAVGLSLFGLLLLSLLVFGSSQAAFAQATATATWVPLWTTPTPEPTLNNDCGEQPSDWGQVTPNPLWYVNCGQCELAWSTPAPVWTSNPTLDAILTGTPGTPSVSSTPAPGATSTPDPAADWWLEYPVNSGVFYKGFSMSYSGNSQGFTGSYRIVNRAPNPVSSQFLIYHDMTDQLSWANSGWTYTFDRFFRINSTNIIVVPGVIYGSQGVSMQTNPPYGFSKFWGYAGETVTLNVGGFCATGCTNVNHSFSVNVYLEEFLQPTATPAPTQYVTNCSGDLEEYGGGEGGSGSGELPVIRIGTSVCPISMQSIVIDMSAINLVTGLQIGNVTVPGFSICFTPIQFGILRIFDIEIDIDLIALMLSSVTALYFMVRS